MFELLVIAGVATLVVGLLAAAESEPDPVMPDDGDEDYGLTDELPDGGDATDLPQPVPGPGLLWMLPGISREGKPKWGGRFAAHRSNEYLHKGIDLGAPRGADIVAPEDGIIVATQGWLGPNTRGVHFLTKRDDGPMLVVGAVEPGSWPTIPGSDSPVGVPVARGQRIARVGIYPKGSTMLHLETWRRDAKRKRRWKRGEPPPDGLLDPTPYVEAMV